ncbi:hypothetical protein DMB38_08520 [Streptomyces sp. WAC 06738]|uniref:hypothetical protein n=1 Tax=Streptomyces sp. WAC 06738 TaxID=2203210 RepID=UPI000F71AAB7|nr:hypothetical protein [Streptomyces sp. WAC 06738]AZM50645.1 hypothetical protein DMB38_08520 [Streptomyces sp. WAC 06738]
MASLLYDDSAPPPGPVQFQLVLLRRMKDFQPDLVAGALRALGVPRTAMREANRRWQGRLRARGGPAAGAARARDFAALLGPPASVTRRAHGDMALDVHVWPVPLWPDLRFEATCGVGGVALNAWLVRAPDAAGPALRTLADLAPWGCTVDEVARAVPPAAPRETAAAPRFALAFTAPDAAGEPRACTAEFAWGLVQRWTID